MKDLFDVLCLAARKKLEIKRLELDPKRLPKPGELWVNMGPRKLCASECRSFSYPPYEHDHSLIRIMEDGAIILILEPPTKIHDPELSAGCWHIKFLHGSKVSCSTMYFTFFPTENPEHMVYPIDQLEAYEELSNILKS